MKKTFNINLGGLIFHVDEDAFTKLEHYLSVLKKQFAKTEGGDEIVKDVEMRMAELFRKKTSDSKEVINLDDIDEVIGILGQPEDYMDDEAESESAREAEQIPYVKSNRKIYRDGDDRILGGVSAGLAAYFSIDPLWIRILFVALLFAGFGIPLYIVLWIVVPRAKTTAEKLQMRGEPVTLSNIERSIKEEAAQVSKRFKSYTAGASNYDYKGGLSRTGGFIGDLGRFLVDLVKLAFRLIFKVLGFVLLLIGFLFLGGLLIAALSGSMELIGNGYALDNAFDFLRQVVASDTHYNALITGVTLLLAAPLFILIYYGIRLLFKVEPLNKQVRSGLAILALVGFALTIYSGIRIGVEFRSNAWHVERENLSVNGITQIAVLEDSVYTNLENHGVDGPHIFSDGRLALKMVQLDIRQSTKGYSYLEKEVEAHGSSRREANIIARNLKYQARLDSGVFTFPNYYLLGADDKFRAQEVDLILYLMPGDTVRLMPGTENLIYNIENLNNYWDYDMIDHTWTMTEEGLLCVDCADTPEVLERLQKEKEEAEHQKELDKQREESEVHSDGDKVIISSLQADSSGIRFLGLICTRPSCMDEFGLII